MATKRAQRQTPKTPPAQPDPAPSAATASQPEPESPSAVAAPDDGELVTPPAGSLAGFARPGTEGFTEARTMRSEPPPGQVAGYARPGIDGFSF